MNSYIILVIPCLIVAGVISVLLHNLSVRKAAARARQQADEFNQASKEKIEDLVGLSGSPFWEDDWLNEPLQEQRAGLENTQEYLLKEIAFIEIRTKLIVGVLILIGLVALCVMTVR